VRKLLLLVLLIGCINSPTPKLVPMLPVEPDSIGWLSARERIAQADGVIVGKIKEIKEDWLYDDPCGFVRIVQHQCDGTVTYRLDVVNEQRSKWLWTFAHAYGTFGLFAGEEAIFVWKRLPIDRLKECRERAAMYSGSCSYDLLDVLTSDLDVLPVSDSAKVLNLYHEKH